MSYQPDLYQVHFGDCIPHMHEMENHSIDFSIFSPPFPSVFSYTSLTSDLGNVEDLKGEVKLHFSFFFRSLLKVMKPGRVVILHCQQIIRMKRTGESGMFDFRGLLIRLAIRAGFIYEYDWLIRKGPQAQVIRTKSRSLQFSGLESDRASSRGAMGDYLLKFVAPGENKVAIELKCLACGENHDAHMIHPVTNARVCPGMEDSEWEPNALGMVTRNEWIDWAECCWMDIRETDTLNVSEGRAEEDTRHICPLQLTVIRRCIKLFSNPGEIVFSPFTGIGSEGYEAVKLGRRFYGCELKPEYHATALRNLDRAAKARIQDEQPELFVFQK